MMPPDASGCWSPSGGELRSLWFEPWHDAHPSWLAEVVAPQGWAHLSCVSATGLRLAYQLFCHHFQLQTMPGAVLCPPRLQLLCSLPLSHEHMHQAALFLGMVTCASLADFVKRWVQDNPALKAMGHLALWREAVRLARARPLPMAADQTPVDITPDSLMNLGLCQIRAVSEALQYGLWSRLQFRFSRQIIEAHHCLASPEGAPADDVTARHILRAWQVACMRSERH